MLFAIGDIHGEITKLRQLIRHILTLEQNPALLFIGDYVDKGEDSKAVLDYLLELQSRYTVHFLMGNHEFHWLNLRKDPRSIAFLERYGGRQVLEAFRSDDFYNVQERFLSDYAPIFQGLKLYHMEAGYLFVHSGLAPDKFDTDADRFTARDVLFNRYRFFEHQALYRNQYRIIFGHTGFYFPYVDPFKIGIDTAAVYSKHQPLTAFWIEEEVFVTSDHAVEKINRPDCHRYCPGIYREPG